MGNDQSLQDHRGHSGGRHQGNVWAPRGGRFRDSEGVGGRAADAAAEAAEALVLDEKSTALHRAACHGDVEVLKAVLATTEDQSPLDGSNRTPLHVAAMQGKHEVFAHLTGLLAENVNKLEAVKQMQACDDSGRTAYEIMADFDPVVDTHRTQIVEELLEDVQVHLFLHSLSGRYFAARQLYLVFFPLLLLTALTAVTSSAGSDPELTTNHKRRLSIFIGFCATVAMFAHLSNHGLKFSSRAAMHRSAAHDLQELAVELAFQHVSGFVTGEDGESAPVDVPMVKKRLETIKEACKSEVPVELGELYTLLRKHLSHWLIEARVPKVGPDYKMLKGIAYTRAEISVTNTIGWPFRCPAPKGAVRTILQTVRKAYKAQKAAEPPGRLGNKKISGGGPSEGILMTFGHKGKGLAVEAARKHDSARLATPTGLPAQCWALDKDRRLVPLGHGLKSKAALSGKREAMALYADDEDDFGEGVPVLLGAADKGHRWTMNASTGFLSTEVGGVTKFLGHDGSGGGPTDGAHVVVVDERSDKKLKLKFANDLKS